MVLSITYHHLNIHIRLRKPRRINRDSRFEIRDSKFNI